MEKKQPPGATPNTASVEPNAPTRRHLIAALGTAGGIAALGVKSTARSIPSRFSASASPAW